MSPRPRKVSDEEIFAAALRAMSRIGPGELTLAHIAEEAGVTAGALVQRFGSKRELQLALAARGAEGTGDLIRALAMKHRSALAALRDYAACMAQLAASPDALARNLAYLQIDLVDPDFRKHLLVQARATRAAMQALLEEAVRKGELVANTDTRLLARTIETILSGALMTWAVYREGSAARWLRECVDTALAPHLPPRRGAKRRSAGRRSR